MNSPGPPVIPLHPTVPDPYTIVTQMPQNTTCFTVLNLKVAFFCIPLTHIQNACLLLNGLIHVVLMEQYTWTALPQGFRNRPLFGIVLAKELRELTLMTGAVLQYVEDLVICSPSKEGSDENTIQVLNFPVERVFSGTGLSRTIKELTGDCSLCYTHAPGGGRPNHHAPTICPEAGT